MTGQHARSLEAILQDRLRLTQDIAAANREHLRLVQIARGLEVLALKEDRDGEATAALGADQETSHRALDDSLETLNRLDAMLAGLDDELARAMKGQIR